MRENKFLNIAVSLVIKVITEYTSRCEAMSYNNVTTDQRCTSKWDCAGFYDVITLRIPCINIKLLRQREERGGEKMHVAIKRRLYVCVREI